MAGSHMVGLKNWRILLLLVLTLKKGAFEEGIIAVVIGASLSELHTSVTTLLTCVVMFAWTDHLP